MPVLNKYILIKIYIKQKAKKIMVNPKIDYFLDIFLGISFILSALSGIVMYFVPWGSEQIVLGISRSNWPIVHEWSSFIMAGLVLLHLIFHLKWIGQMTRCIFRKEEK